MASVLSAYRILQRHFGFSLSAVRALAMFSLRTSWNTFTCALDRVLYPGFARLPIDRPVFILGNPRSGTTLLHRFLAETQPLCATALWEMLFPAICARHLLRPLFDRLVARYTQPPEDAAIHETGPAHAETDDAFLLLQYLEGPLAWCAFNAWEESFAGQIQSVAFAQSEAQRLLPRLEQFWRRTLHYHQRSRLLVKSSSVTAEIPTLLSRHPDARLLYMMRNPLQVIPSAMSLVEHNYVRSLSRIRSPSPQARTRYFENVYLMMCLLYRRFHEQRVAGAIPERNLRIVSYRRLVRDFAGELADILSFIEVPSGPVAQRIAEYGARQSERKSQHRYTLEQYGLSEERVRRDLDFVFRNYDVE